MQPLRLVSPDASPLPEEGVLGPIVVLLTDFRREQARQFDKLEDSIRDRFAENAREITKLRADIDEHLQAAHNAKVAREAQVKPVTTFFGWVFDHWERIVMVTIACLVFLNFLASWFGQNVHIFGVTPTP